MISLWKREHTRVIVAGIASVLLYLSLYTLSEEYSLLPLPYFYMLLGALWGCLYYACRAEESAIDYRLVIVGALVFRCIGIFATPIYEDDYYRYLWDGYIFATQGSPYGIAPAEYFNALNLSPTWEHILDGINNPDLPTIYGPLLQYAYLLAYMISPGDLIAFKLILLIADGFILLYLSKMLSPRWWFFYAWCPLLIFETYFNAHPDLVAVAFLVAAYYYFTKHKLYVATILAGIATCGKVFGLLLVPFILKRTGWKGMVVFISTILLLYFPVMLRSPAGDVRVLSLFTQTWEFNSSIVGVLYEVGIPYASFISLGIWAMLAGLIYFRWIQQKTTLPPLSFLYGTFFLFSPVVNPWYLLWLLPFAIMNTPRYWTLSFLVVVSLSYITGLNMGITDIGPYDHPVWLRPIEFGIIALAALVGWIESRRKGTSPVQIV